MEFAEIVMYLNAHGFSIAVLLTDLMGFIENTLMCLVSVYGVRLKGGN